MRGALLLRYLAEVVRHCRILREALIDDRRPLPPGEFQLADLLLRARGFIDHSEERFYDQLFRLAGS